MPAGGRSCLGALLLLLVLLSTPHNALATTNQAPAGRQALFDWLLRRLQPVWDSNSTDDTPDFASTANALTEQAVREANVRAAALARRTASTQQDSSSSGNGSSNGTVGDAAAAALQLLELQQQTANASTGLDSSSDTASAESAGLQLLLHTIKEQWEAARNRQRDQSGPDRRASASEQWTEGLAAMAGQYPSLSGFASLVSNNSALRVSVQESTQACKLAIPLCVAVGAHGRAQYLGCVLWLRLNRAHSAV
jgi:hypothetical protein